MNSEYAGLDRLKIGLIADTHMPGALDRLWPAVHQCFADVDLILHAGDLHVPGVIDELETLAPTFVCRGNGDEDVEHPRLQDAWCEPLAGQTVGLIHKFPSPRNADAQRLAKKRRQIFGEVDLQILIYGHTHFAEVARIDDCLYINPGSPTLPNNQSTRLGTLGLLEINGARVDVDLLQLTDTGVTSIGRIDGLG